MLTYPPAGSMRAGVLVCGVTIIDRPGLPQLRWPTLTASDAKGGHTTSKGKRQPANLGAAVRGLNVHYWPLVLRRWPGPFVSAPSMTEIPQGPLNPPWCEWFMGFPPEWSRT